MISVRQTRALPKAFFRFHLTMDTLAFGYTLPTTRVCYGLSPIRLRPYWAHYKKSRTAPRHSALTCFKSCKSNCSLIFLSLFLHGLCHSSLSQKSRRFLPVLLRLKSKINSMEKRLNKLYQVLLI